MAQKHVVKVSNIMELFAEDIKCFKKGERAYEANHVVRFHYDAAVGLITGEVNASMRDKLYKVEITLADGDIESYQCSCPRGTLICHHIAALALHAHYNVSVTDTECSWSKKKSTGEKVKSVKDLFPVEKFTVLTKPIASVDIDTFQKDILSLSIGFAWLFSPELESISYKIIKTVDDLIWSMEYISSTDKVAFFKSSIAVTDEEIVKVSAATVGQWQNPLWLILKKHRLTASNFGLVLRACKRRKFPPSLFKTLAGSYNLDGVKAVQWGKDHENDAVLGFEREVKMKVSKTGLWLHPCGYLGASPDGVIDTDIILEVKCPFKYKDIGLKDCVNYIVDFNKVSNEFVINKNHVYYDQLQGQLHITGKKIFFWLYGHCQCLLFWKFLMMKNGKRT